MPYTNEDSLMNSVTHTARPAAPPPSAPATRRRALPRLSSRTLLAAGQWLVTLLLCAFLIVPVVMSIMAGLTVN
jgi:putative spermidine/putrescine transport system permease protein